MVRTSTAWCTTPTGVQYLAIRYTERLADEGAVGSVGSKGDSGQRAGRDGHGLHKTELIRPKGPWKTVDDVELATAAWVHCWNTSRLHGACGDIPAHEFEAAYYRRKHEAEGAA
jgi:putative transposase